VDETPGDVTSNKTGCVRIPAPTAKGGLLVCPFVLTPIDVELDIDKPNLE
jgi:hypothetical protein